MLMLDRGRAVAEKRRVLWLLVVRDLKVRYANSWLGYVWTVLDPLMMSGVYWFVFGLIFAGARRGIGYSPYILFLVVGVLAWQWFNGAVNDTTRALTQESKLVRSTNLPREIWVLKIIGAKGVEYVFSIPVVVFFMIIYRQPPTWQALWAWPLAIVLQGLLLSGLGMALAAATVLMTDLQRLVRILLRMWFYLTPVVYGVNKVPEEHHLRDLMALNPMTGILDLYRRGVFPNVPTGWHIPVAGAVISVLVFFAGAVIFRRLERAVLKEI